MDGEAFLCINTIGSIVLCNVGVWFFSSWTWEFFMASSLFFGILGVLCFLMAVFIDG